MKPELGTEIDLIGPELGTEYLRTFFLTPALIAESERLNMRMDIPVVRAVV